MRDRFFVFKYQPACYRKIAMYFLGIYVFYVCLHLFYNRIKKSIL